MKCKCGKEWKIQDNLSAYAGEVVLVCDCGERYFNAQEHFDEGTLGSLEHIKIPNQRDNRLAEPERESTNNRRADDTDYAGNATSICQSALIRR